MNSNEGNSRSVRMGSLPKVVHAILMLVAAPIVVFVGIAIVTKALPALAIPEWIGVGLIGLIISWVVLIWASRSTTWVIFLVLVETSAYFYAIAPAVEHDLHSRSARTESMPLNDRPALKSAPIRSEQIAGDPRFKVIEVIDELQPGWPKVVDKEIITRLEEFTKEDVAVKAKARGAPDGMLEVETGTMLLQEDGKTIYATEVIIASKGETKSEARRMWIFWNIEGEKLKRVQCTFPHGGYAYRRGECGKQIAKTFDWQGWHTP